MQIDDRVRCCVGFVGTGTASNFTAHGTGFFVHVHEEDFVFDYFVSAQHLIWPNRRRTQRPPETKMAIRLNTKEGDAVVISAPPKDWFYPEDPSTDLCAIRSHDLSLDHTPSEKLEVASINLETMIIGPHNAEAFGLSLGDEVFISGAFVGRVGYRKNIPIVRIANIAAMPEEPIEFASPKIPAYLIETRSLGGTSGSPIFFNFHRERMRGKDRHGLRLDSLPGGREQDRRKHILFPYRLLGMIIFIHGGNYLQDFVSEDDSDIHPFKDADFNAGIAVAMPAMAILDLLKSDKVKEARIAELEERKKRSGVRPASALQEGNPPSTDENPNQQEDFMRLVDAQRESVNQKIED